MLVQVIKMELNSWFSAYVSLKFILVLCTFCMVFIMYALASNGSPPDFANEINYSERKIDYKDLRWTWECRNSRCERNLTPDTKRVSLETCNMMCLTPQLWPIPTGLMYAKNESVKFFSQQMVYVSHAAEDVENLLQHFYTILNENILSLIENQDTINKSTDIKQFFVNVTVLESSTDLNLETNETYNLRIRKVGEDVIANVTAVTYYGARHGLETLSQLIWWDDVEETLKVLSGVDIEDKPSFPYRGVMVDTARNYFPLSLLKKIVEGMAANKLNVFHWHITDTQSFPLKTNKTEKFAYFGSYKPDLTYDEKQIQEFVQFAKIRGVRVILEVDAPAHINRGWEWGPMEDVGKLIVCENRNIMEGQVNIGNPYVLDLLQGIYEDVISLNTNNEIFHLGGDEVDLDCWQETSANRSNSDMYEVWGQYLDKMLERVKIANNNTTPKHIVLWSSPLTQPPHLQKYLNNSNIVVQTWLGDITPIVHGNFKLIFSTVGRWYLDCGFGRWRESAAAVCDPYTPWQTFYNYNPWTYYNCYQQTLGGEVCMWTEQVEVDSLETRIWPRSAAFAERVWSNPRISSSIPENVYTRLDTQRRRMIKRGLKAEGMWPQLCTLNPGKCL